MTTRIAFIVTLLVGLLFGPALQAQDQRYLLVGTVTLSSGQVTAGVKLKLLKDGAEKDLTQTDAQGNYGFFDIPGNPGDYSIEVIHRGQVVRTIPSADLKVIARGGRLDFSLP